MRTAEQHFAIREAQHNAAAEAYFAARPELDLPLGVKTFEAGFVRPRGSPSAYGIVGPAVKHRSGIDQQRLVDLREKLKVFERFSYKASAEECRRKIRALERGFDPEAPQIDVSVDRPSRKRVTRSRPLANGRYLVRLTCGHDVAANGVQLKQTPGKRAPYTAVCTICNP